ncbi:hypothetical protein NQ275_25190, partial [Escherichia coli]|nr:hypothetical protein [Escherichia coli]
MPKQGAKATNSSNLPRTEFRSRVNADSHNSAAKDSTRPFHFAVQQLSDRVTRKNKSPQELLLSLVNNVEFLRHLPKMSGFGGLGAL